LIPKERINSAVESPKSYAVLPIIFNQIYTIKFVTQTLKITFIQTLDIPSHPSIIVDSQNRVYNNKQLD